MNSAIQRLNNRGQKECHGNQDSCSFEWGWGGAVVLILVFILQNFSYLWWRWLKNMNFEEFKEGLKDYGLDMSDEVWTAISYYTFIAFWCKNNSADTVKKIRVKMFFRKWSKQNPLGNWIILTFSGQKPFIRIF